MKSLDLDENFKPERTLFCRELRFVAIFALFGNLWAKKVPFGSKTVFLGQEMHYYIVYIAITRKNDPFVAKIVNTCLTKIFLAIFAPDERLPSPATLADTYAELVFYGIPYICHFFYTVKIFGE